ncbi:type II secretion system F family protein [Enteractinococcus coprophilus]|uniref:Tight adherence protein B n=1 Tax=Enteractinococcus coprophilus TaxID=1027633 RepID=A0A543AGE1_9MICC|nr:type II secretion system F family protein [Enteractinococcus coprophilus]TQL71654.1 tight adherence protein B [Enteractinococcus coprophilus]
MTSTLSTVMVVGAAFTAALAVAGLAYVLIMPWPVRVPMQRRRPGVAPKPHPLHRAFIAVTNLAERRIRDRSTPAGSQLLELAGIKLRPEQFMLRILIAAGVAGLVGVIFGNIFIGLLLMLTVLLVHRLFIGLRVSKRQHHFADQLEDSLLLIASSLRAGHSLPQALASLAEEAESPTAEEFTRVVNETRVGRDLGEALETTAERMDSEDFTWVTQAIEINREVGGNLAEVLDGVAGTIRQRNEVRRQVATLSAEGRLSAVILMVLPFGVGGFLLLTNPSYLAPFVESPIGYMLLVISALLLVVGGLWLRKTVEVKF